MLFSIMGATFVPSTVMGQRYSHSLLLSFLKVGSGNCLLAGVLRDLRDRLGTHLVAWASTFSIPVFES